ncbi:TRAFAC clade GTPase domain-containing protein [Zunongwangia profunda]|uniref:TRAFAC clade GTPase domain-containing protein n=1 Tax=Zunongwangia profunda TaxID=398743 RepID=UPI0030DB43E6
MTGKCSNPECAAPISCHEGKEKHTECELWMKSNSLQSKTKPTPKKEKKSDLPWTGDALTIEELSKVTYRNTPVIIGVVGKADAGKTTYLAMLYTLLLRGVMLKEFDFCGTKTINAWDELYQKLKIQQEGVKFPDPTPAQYIRLLHLALRNHSKRLKDIFISDAAGEVFSIWSKNRNDDNAENARWVYEHSNAFILFIDCEDLITRKAQAKTDIIDMAQMLKHDLRNRPVIAVWSKSDKKEGIHPIIQEKLQGELKEIFENYEEIDISNFSSDDPDVLVHKNNLVVLDWLLSKVFTVKKSEILIMNDNTDYDIFLNYKKI